MPKIAEKTYLIKIANTLIKFKKNCKHQFVSLWLV